MNPHGGLLVAAISGALFGAFGCASNQPTPEASSAMPAGDGAPMAGNDAAGMGEGAKHGCKGQNSCKGQGGCKTDQHACKGQNDCKGQGGCKTS